MIKFNIASINRCTEVEGPYKRLCIWFQGCNIHCDECCNPDYQALLPKHIMTLDELLAVIIEAKNEFGIEGVTYSGGEPTLQQNLSQLTNKIHEYGFGVISFTGYNYESVADKLVGCDVVLDGPFQKDKLDTTRRLLGSSNQRILCLTDRYKNLVDDWFNDKNSVAEINIGDSIIINGDKV